MDANNLPGQGVVGNGDQEAAQRRQDKPSAHEPEDGDKSHNNHPPHGGEDGGGNGGLPDFDDDDDGGSAMTPSSEDDKDQLEALLEILTEAFNEVDQDNSGTISTEQLGTVLDNLAEEGVIEMYTDEELELLANDMDVERNGYIPLEEFKDVLVRRSDGYDFTDVEIKEAFSVLDVSDTGTVSAKELRAVMLACCEMEVRFIDGKKMIEAASAPDSTDKSVINFEEFKNIINWRPVEEDFEFDPTGAAGSGDEEQNVA